MVLYEKHVYYSGTDIGWRGSGPADELQARWVMRFLFDPIKEKEQKLERFRQSFKILVSDGHYPPDRQQRLYQACQKAGLDWNEARAHVRKDALALLAKTVDRIIDDEAISAREISELRKLQKRLAIPDEQSGTLIDKVYDLVERKIANKIIEYAAYLGEEQVAQTLNTDISAYDLPQLRTTKLLTQLNRQHQLAKMMIGNLVVIQTNVGLYKDEACHYDEAVTVLTEGSLVEGRLLVTSKRLLVIAASGGIQAEWAQCRAVEMMENSLVLVTSMHNAMIICNDPQYVSTLIASARRRYVPQEAPTPIRQGKRL